MEESRNKFYIVSLIACITVAILTLLAILDYVNKQIPIPQELWFVLGFCGAFITGLHIPFNLTGKD